MLQIGNSSTFAWTVGLAVLDGDFENACKEAGFRQIAIAE
jgi:hypothetical protein